MRFRSSQIRTLLATLIMVPYAAFAHSPHHVITDLAASPSGDSGSDVFILVTDQVFRSDRHGASWKNLANGLNNQFSFTSVVTSPSYAKDSTVFVSTAGDGVYQSSDAGHSWQPINNGLEKLDVARLSAFQDGSGTRHLLAAAASGGVWRHTDGDDRWRLVLTEKIQIRSFSVLSGSGTEVEIYAGDSSGRVWHSEDDGRLWEILLELPGAPSITSIAATGNSIFVGTNEKGLYSSLDSGHSIARVVEIDPVRQVDCQGRELAPPVADHYISSVSIHPLSSGAQQIFVTTWYDGVFVSTDNGNNWSRWNDGLSCDQQADDMHEAHFRGVVAASAEDGQATYWLAAFDGLFKSSGVDAEWQQLETLPLGLIKGMAVTGGESSPLAIALATYGGGFYLTEDRGENWTIGNKGLQTTRLTGLSFSPDYGSDGVIFAGASRRLLRSNDRGQSWQRINLQPATFGQRVRNKLRRWGLAGSSGTSGSRQIYPTFIVQPPDAGGERVLFGTRFHGVMGYDHGTGDIASLWSGTDRIMNGLEMSNSFAEDRTLFASVRNEGVIRSDDGGISWTPTNTGLDFVSRWSANPRGGDFRRDALIAISPDFAADQTVFAGSPAGDGLYASYDRGESWSKLQISPDPGAAPVLAVALSPDFATDDSVMVSIKGKGLYRSRDRGISFTLIGEQLIAANASVEWLDYSFGFSHDRAIIAASDEQLFVSSDGGDSWSEVARPVRYEDMRDVISYSGDRQRHNSEAFSAMTETRLSARESSARLQFVGDGVRWLGSCETGQGSAHVFIDGIRVATVHCAERPPTKMQELFITNGLGEGAHTIEIRNVATESGEVAGVVSIDAFDILPANDVGR